MGSCMSNEKKPIEKSEITTLEDKNMKVEDAQLKKIAEMTKEQKIQYSHSSEFVEFLRLCSVNDIEIFQEVLNQALPDDQQVLLKQVQLLNVKIKIQRDKQPLPQHKNHVQFVSMVHNYFWKFETSFLEYIKGKNIQLSTLQSTFTIQTKLHQILLTLQDENLLPTEKWWKCTNQQLFQEINECKQLYDQEVNQVATDYLAGLYGNLNLQSDQDNLTEKMQQSGKIQSDNKSESASQAVKSYLPFLYNALNTAVDQDHQ